VTTLVAGTGLVGSHLVRALLLRGESPVGIDRAPDEDNLAELRGRFPLIVGDVQNLALLVETIRTHRIDRIVNTVALVGPAAEASIYEAYRTNVTGAVNVLEAARLCDVRRVVFYSSMAIYDPAPGTPPLSDLIDEDAPKKPAGMNGAAKIAVEAIGEAYAAAAGLGFVSLRTGGVYGAGRSSGGVPQQLRACAAAIVAGEPYTFEAYVFTGRTDLIEARDAAAAGVAALDAAHPAHGAYNIGNGEAFSYEELAAAVRAACPQATIGVRPSGTPVRVGERTMATSRATAELGFTAEWPFARGFPALVEWVRGRIGRSPNAKGSA
jgi:UDP-glucose 4-epimerase